MRYFLVIVLLSATLFASEDWNFSKKYVAECDSELPSKINNCLEKRYKSVDKKLNTIYQILKKKTINNDTVLLVSAQKSWLKFKEEECKFYNPKELNFGSYYIFEQLVCEIDMTEKRIKDLERYLKRSGCGSCRW